MLRTMTRLLGTVGVALLLSPPVVAVTPKEPRHPLDQLVMVRPQLRVPQTPVNLDDRRPGQQSPDGLHAFRAEHGKLWSATLDKRRNVVTILNGGAIPFVPGKANGLRWEDFDPTCRDASCLPKSVVERLTRTFLDRYQGLLGIDSRELALDASNAGPVEHMYYATYKQVVNGIPVDGAALRFHINRGNLLQVSTSRLAPVTVSTAPAFEASAASSILAAYLGGFPDASDLVLDPGSLVLIPITPPGADPDAFSGPAGTGITHALAYRIAFSREGVTGTWEALIDARTGEILRFVDTNRYGRVHGGVYPGDGHTGATDRPFPFVQTDLPAPDDFADQGGRFPGDSATVNFTNGKYTWINDFCGPTSLATTTGDADYTGWPDPVGMDCAVPSPNPGSTGNTMSARTQYYHVTMANIKARTYYPANSWLNTSHMNVNVNQSPWCNATSGGGTLNFYKAAAGCWNLGEIPGVSLHEWGHSWDDFDGSGGGSPPVEARADWTAAVLIHSSCLGAGFIYPSGNCSGYGDPCLNCTGIRDGDYWKHASKTPWTPANNGSVYSCAPGSYNGPCGWEDHCESGIATQALWDMVKGPHTSPEPSGDFYTLSGLDVPSGWQLMDRLFWTSTATLDNMYNCTAPTSSGCTGDTLYNTFMAIDDDGDGVANGTPHAAAIFAALNRHNIACGAANDPQNQSHASPACVALAKPQNLTTLGQNNQVVLNWNAVPSATRYEVLRNETDCGAGYTKVGTVDAPSTTFTDDTVVNGITYYYRIQPFYESPPACTGSYGPMSDCATAVPVPCQMPGSPFSLTATPAGDNKTSLSWSNGAPIATTFNVYRSIGTCPGTGYTRIATGVTGTSYLDDPVSGQVTYAYAVTGRDDTALCETAQSNCSSAQTTGLCTQAPVFAGLGTVSDPAGATCGLNLSWGGATAYCGGPLQYNIYRSTTPGFAPGPSNLLATVSSTSYSDMNTLVSGTTYFYVVRAVDSANGVEEINSVRRSGRPTGPPTVGTWIDDAGDAEPSKMTFMSRCGGPVAWTVSQLQNTTPGGARSYRSVLAPDANNPSGTVPDNNCSALVTPPLSTSSGGIQVSFWTRWDQEANWDGVVMEARVCGDPSCTTGTWQIITNAELEPDYPSTLFNSQTGNCSGAGACGDVFPYPSGDGTEWIDDCDYPSSTQAFTGTNATWTHYVAALPPSYSNATIQVRFNLSTDCASRNTGSFVDDISVTNVFVPGTCQTGSPCPGNPLVNVTPEGPLNLCPGSSQLLTASLSGGIGPFTYQWTVDGAPIAGANGPTYMASTTGLHAYNCRVQGSGCSDFVFDPSNVTMNWQAAPVFAGLASVTNQSSGTCGLTLSWPAATSPCPGGVTYSVYRSTTSPVAIVPANRVASSLTSTSYTDTEGLSSGVTYRYVVRAVSVATHAMDGNTVERSATPAVSGPAFSDSFESGNQGWTFAKGAIPATSGDFVIGDPVGTMNGIQPSQPQDDHTPAPGVNALYTAANPTGDPNVDDVDKGEVIATSPAFNLSGYASASLSVWRWFYNATVGDAEDYYVQEVSNNNGSTWVQVEQVPDTVTNANTWTQVQSSLQSLLPLTSTMRLRFRVSDGRGPSDIVEFAADDIAVTGVCTAGPVGPPPVGDGTGGTLPMTLSKGTGNQINITVDNAACQGDHVVILAGAIGNWSGYQWAPSGCAFSTGSGTGTITETNPNVWYIAVWSTSGGVGGNPGDASSGERTWPAAGFCSIAGDDPGDQVCN